MLAMDMNDPRLVRALTIEITRIIEGTGGKVVEAIGYELAKGGGWSVILDSEYAALPVPHIASQVP